MIEGFGHTIDDLWRTCKEEGLYFEQSDIGDCYVSETEDCECFEESEMELD